MAGLLDLLSQTWPARLAQDAWNAAKLPGDVYAGRTTPHDPDYYGRAVDLAGIIGLLNTGTFAAPAAESLASKSPAMYNPPTRPLRSFTSDYPQGASADAAGRLTTDIEGRPLTARYVAGRNVVGGNDQAFPAAEFDALGKATTGRRIAVVPAREIGGDLGRTAIDPLTELPRQIRVRNDMQLDKAAMVTQHELGHAIDQTAGKIPTAGLSGELKGVYNTLNNPNRGYPDRSEAAAWGRPFTPQALGYKADEIPREYMVEAIRAYMTDPNYLKTAAPNTAARIREFVNAHPDLSKIIQFNSIAGLMGLGLSNTEDASAR